MSAGNSNGRVDSTLWGISDTEMLAIVDDVADENGWATTIDVRLQLGEDVESRERTGVGIRLAWLRRYGWLEKGETVRVEQADRFTHTSEWRLTAIGQALIDHPELTAAMQTALGKLNPAQRVHLTRELGEAGQHGPQEIRDAIRRQFRRSMGVPR